MPIVFSGWILLVLVFYKWSITPTLTPLAVHHVHAAAAQQQTRPSRYDQLEQVLKKEQAARVFYSIGNGGLFLANITWTCPPNYELIRFGPIWEGGKWICLPAWYTKPCVIYSWGSNGDFEFELAMHTRRPYCEIHTFDCTINPGNKPAFVHYHLLCLGKDPGQTYWDILRQLNHTQVAPVLVKMDIEGWEWVFFEEYSHDRRIPRIPQLVVEVHQRVSRAKLPLANEFDSIPIAPEVADGHGDRVLPLLNLFRLWSNEFALVAVEHNTERSPPAAGGQVACSTCFEFTLVANTLF